MKFKFLFLTAVFAVSFLACKSDTKTHNESKESTTESTAKEDACKYGVKSSEVKVNWTAFKMTEKVGVKGVFDDVEINTVNGAPSLSTLMLGTSFKINTKSVNSNDPARDIKLVNFFFGRMTGNLSIIGHVKSVEGSNDSGKGIMIIKMNGVDWDTAFEYTVADKVLNLTTTINTDNWNGQEAIASINKACEDKHKGADGISKTWPDVNVSVVVPLNVTCD